MRRNKPWGKLQGRTFQEDKHICKDPEVKAIVGCLWSRRMPSGAGESERKVPDGDQRGGQGLDHAHARSQATGRTLDFFFFNNRFTVI